MALKLTCACGCRMSVDDSSAGTKVKCPLCHKRVLVPALDEPEDPESRTFVREGPPPLPRAGGEEIMIAEPADLDEPDLDEPDLDEPVVADRPPKKKRGRKARLREEKRRLRTVGHGLTLIYWGIICLLLGLVLRTMIICAAGSAFFVSRGSLDLLGVSRLLSELLQDLTLLLCLAGSVLCCWVPLQSRARGIMITSAALDATAFGIALLSLVFAVAAMGAANIEAVLAGRRLMLAFTSVSLLLRFVGFLLFFFFFRNLAEYLDDRGTASAAMEIMARWIWLTITGILVFLVGGSMIFILGCFGMLVFLIAFIVWFTSYVKQWIRVLNLIAAMKNTLAFKWGV